MTAVTAPTLPITSFGPIMRALEAALRDRTWENSPVGQEVRRYLRALRWASKAENTLKAYEAVLALFALRHDDWPSLEDFCSPAGTEYIREFLDVEWGRSAPATKQQRTAILHSFFQWAAIERRISYDPSATIKAPRRRGRADRQAYPLAVLHKLVAAQDSLRDQCALQLLCRMGLRKNELRLLRVRDVDLVRDYVLVHGKGGTTELLPIVGTLKDDLYLHLQAEGRHLDEYLLYARERRDRPMDPATVHRWFKRCLANAELPLTVKTHEMRHSAADAIYRVRGDIVMAQMLLRHVNVSTTEAYLHPTKRDLADALAALDRAWGK